MQLWNSKPRTQPFMKVLMLLSLLLLSQMQTCPWSQLQVPLNACERVHQYELPLRDHVHVHHHVKCRGAEAPLVNLKRLKRRWLNSARNSPRPAGRQRKPQHPPPTRLLSPSHVGNPHQVASAHGVGCTVARDASRPCTQQNPNPDHLSPVLLPGHPSVYNVYNVNSFENVNNLEDHKRAQGPAYDSPILTEGEDYAPHLQSIFISNNSSKGDMATPTSSPSKRRGAVPQQADAVGDSRTCTAPFSDEAARIVSEPRTPVVRIQELPLGAAAPDAQPTPSSP